MPVTADKFQCNLAKKVIKISISSKIAAKIPCLFDLPSSSCKCDKRASSLTVHQLKGTCNSLPFWTPRISNSRLTRLQMYTSHKKQRIKNQRMIQNSARYFRSPLKNYIQFWVERIVWMIPTLCMIFGKFQR